MDHPFHPHCLMSWPQEPSRQPGCPVDRIHSLVGGHDLPHGPRATLPFLEAEPEEKILSRSQAPTLGWTLIPFSMFHNIIRACLLSS